MKRRSFIKLASLVTIGAYFNFMSGENWHGYALIELNTNAQQSHIDTAISVVGVAGISATTQFPHEKSVLSSSLNGKKMIWEVTMKSNEPPSLDYLKHGLTNFTSLTEQDVDNMIVSFNVLGNASDTRTFMANNASEWMTND